MTEITNYRCDICGEVYLDQESAAKCEAFHVRPSTLQSMFFGSIAKTNIPYPGFLMMQMEDGGMVKYVYNDIINVPKNENQPEEIVEGDEPNNEQTNTDPVGSDCEDDGE